MQVIPLPAPLADDLSAVRVIADEPHSFPCRRCLQDAEAGEALLLVAYDPFLGSSPYTGPGPIYVHERPCTPFAGGGLPDQLTRRLLSVRAYDAQHMLVDAEVTEGAHLEATAAHLLATPSASYLHVHNARPGCFAARLNPT